MTVHGKPLIGGYLSRVSRRRIADVRQEPILDALIALSEGGTLAADYDRDVTGLAPEFVRRARIGFVVIDNSRTTPQLREFAGRALRLRHVEGR